MLAQSLGAAILGVDGALVRVEVDVAFGLPSLTIVGLAGSQVQEARERVRSALRNSGFEAPARRITVNLAPADLPKDGTGYDLPIAIGILAASGQLPGVDGALRTTVLIGELALDGSLRPVAGVMPLVAAARDAGVRRAVVAADDVAEAAAVPQIEVSGAPRLGDVVAHLAAIRPLAVARPTRLPAFRAPAPEVDLNEVQGQRSARRALEIAIAGDHNLALCGPPGVGKTLLLRCASGLQPPLGDDEALEVSRIYSVAGLIDRRAPIRRDRPVRAPHHTVSTAGLVGGGPRVRPGEISLAHRGLLILDEMLEFRSDALDALRQPLDAGLVTITRVEGALSMPAKFALLAAFNPCPCGWRGDQDRSCVCDEGVARRYASRLSGPLRDRLDLWVSMANATTTFGGEVGESSRAVARRIHRVREGQVRRRAAGSTFPLDSMVGGLLAERSRELKLSPRRSRRVAAVARTIADLAESESVTREHLDEALFFRPAAA